MTAVSTDTQKYWNALKEVMDPEFPISVVDMGLIYDIQETNGAVNVTMTFTAVGCACTEWIKGDIENRLLEEQEVREVNIEVVWDPPWTVDRLSEEARERMKNWGVSSR
ncbi:metal-sulfur cluster assembly factor [Bacillus thermotolerans]|uniref:metal-sulfur cluster assembly factor n=1 Tax=Bacillus thermotolerans TaxID=1221996 RepID=UPI00057D967F|nr:metal-sulfur cluster assembly factor [Bacillus thermotolerans]KKB36640.1 Phenylacetic acid degradation protein paaD [Bacillus thermotolerans]KKB41269.1 Phenylacetic acid degradation protein paaD [Bacillus thermotolerans]